MIYSMTAFARVQNNGQQGQLICEIRSINHRYLDIGLYLPEILRSFEMPLREKVREVVKRGKIECNVRFQSHAQGHGEAIKLNLPLATAFCQTAEKIAGLLRTPAAIQPMDVLRLPGVIENNESDAAALKQETFDLITNALSELMAARSREGEELKRLFLEKIEQMRRLLAQVRKQLPVMLNDARERLIKRFADAKVELDPLRLEQEMVYFAQKVDVAEEIERTETHLQEVTRVLKEGGLVGRRLDFLMQELNREANTLGSKSVDPIVTHAVVEMKVLIEQVREQVQNVE